MSREDRDQELYDDFRLEVEKKKLYNNESYDKAILTLSSASLGFSILSLRILIPSGDIEYLSVLFCGWGGLLISITLSLLSFPISNLAQIRSLEIAKAYYLDKNDDAIDMPNKYSAANSYLNDISGVLLICSIIFIVVFSALNMDEKGMSKESEVQKSGQVSGISKGKVDVRNGADVTEMTTRKKEGEKKEKQKDSENKK